MTQFEKMANREGPFSVERPDWQQTFVSLQLNIQDGIARMMQATWSDNMVIMRLHAVQLVDSANALLEWTSAVKNSWSNLFNASQVQKHKVHVMTDIATSLADMVVVLHGGNFSTAYTTMYNVICPRVSCRHLKTEDRVVLKKIFGKFSGKDMTFDMLEDAFLEENPSYARGWKRKQDARVPVEKVLIPSLVAALPKEFTQDKELQVAVHNRFMAFMEGLEQDFTNAGLVEL